MKRKIDFIGIGAAKSGSTWIAECLNEHPEISYPTEKCGERELYFFNTPDLGGLLKGIPSNYDKGLLWYFDQFPQGGKVWGEFCNSYLPDPEAARRIKKFFPEVKLLVALRNPVDMAYSLYWYFKSGVFSYIPDIPDTFEDFVKNRRAKELGLYDKHLTRYFERFPSGNIHIMFFEDVKNRPRELLRELYSFLGVSPDFVPSILGKRLNPTLVPRSWLLKDAAGLVFLGLQKLGLGQLSDWILRNQNLRRLYLKVNKTSRRYPPPRDGKIREELKRYYLKDIENLEKLIGRDLNHWK